MRSILFYIAIILLGSGCEKPLTKKETTFNKLINDFLLQMHDEEQMIAYGTGGSLAGGLNDDKIANIKFVFSFSGIFSIEQARIKMINCANRLFNQINSNIEIRPFLIKYPYPISEIELIIDFKPLKDINKFIEKSDVHAVFLLTGNIIYMNSDNSKQSYEKIFEENYEEALEKIKIPKTVQQ